MIGAAAGGLDLKMVAAFVNRGRGYRAAENQETFALGEVPIDAIYTPVQKVNYIVEHTRVGQMTTQYRWINARAGFLRWARHGEAIPGKGVDSG